MIRYSVLGYSSSFFSCNFFCIEVVEGCHVQLKMEIRPSGCSGGEMFGLYGVRRFIIIGFRFGSLLGV